MNAIAIRPRAAAALVLASLAGLVAFCWPLLADADWTLERSRNAPVYFAGLLLVVLAWSRRLALAWHLSTTSVRRLCHLVRNLQRQQ